MGIKLNQNIKIMDKKELTDKIYSMRSYDLIELACTIREIMKEHGILRKEFKHPVLGYRENLRGNKDCDKRYLYGSTGF